MTTIKEIARRAGVHPTTVSGILNESRGNSRASGETVARVRGIARELGYVPSLVARQLREGKTRTIGFIADDIRNPFFAELAAEMECCLQAHGYQLLLSCQGASSTDPMVEFLRRSVDGLIIWTELEACEKHIPAFKSPAIVHIGSGPSSADRVDIDIARGMALAFRHLSNLGCTRLAFFAPVISETSGLPVPRAEIFEDHLRQYSTLEGVRYSVDHPAWDLSHAAEAARKIQASGNFRANGVITFNDVYATAWLLAAQETRCSLPLVSFDGTAWIRHWIPPVACVHVPTRPIAKAATRLLLRRLTQPDASTEHCLIPPRLIAG